jgi:hypothetical protein
MACWRLVTALAVTLRHEDHWLLAVADETAGSGISEHCLAGLVCG